MQKHHKIYTEHFPSHTGHYSCEVCGKKAEDIHHIKRRSEFGKKTKDQQDQIENLIALCRSCHNKAHANELTKEELTAVHLKKIKKFRLFLLSYITCYIFSLYLLHIHIVV